MTAFEYATRLLAEARSLPPALAVAAFSHLCDTMQSVERGPDGSIVVTFRLRLTDILRVKTGVRW